jgi:hypothetical protein
MAHMHHIHVTGITRTHHKTETSFYLALSFSMFYKYSIHYPYALFFYRLNKEEYSSSRVPNIPGCIHYY